MKTTEWLAIYGALVASLVAIWDIYKWWRSERVYLTGFVTSNMRTYGAATTPETEGNEYTVLRIQNRGAVACEIQLVQMTQYKNFLDRLRGKPSLNGLINHTPNFGPPIPYRLERGGEFSSAALQTDKFVELSKNGWLYLGVGHTMSSKPFLCRVKPISVS